MHISIPVTNDTVTVFGHRIPIKCVVAKYLQELKHDGRGIEDILETWAENLAMQGIIDPYSYPRDKGG